MYVTIDFDLQTSYAVDTPQCVSIVDRFVNLYMDVAVETDDMLVLVSLYHVLQIRNFYFNEIKNKQLEQTVLFTLSTKCILYYYEICILDTYAGGTVDGVLCCLQFFK